MFKRASSIGRHCGGVRRWLPSLLLALPLAVALAWAGSVGAAPPKPEGHSAVRYERQPTRVRTRTPEKKRTRATATTGKGDGPVVTGRPWERHSLATSVKVTDDLIATAKRLLAAVDPTDKDYPDYIFRLANLYLDKRQVFEMQAGAQYETIHALEQQGKRSEATQARARQKRQQNLAHQASVEAVRVLHQLVSDKRLIGYKRLDEGLYYYATELGALGKNAQMQEAYVRLLRDFPTSDFRPQVFLSLADHKYNAGEIGDALRLYQQIIDGFESSPVYAYALYKVGWCHLNPVGTAAPDYARSLQAFVAAIHAANEGRAGSEANGAQLRREARRDLVKAYVHAARPSRAWEFFAKEGNGPTPSQSMQREMMVLLADAYFGEGKYVESSATYKVLLREAPDDPQTCQWQARIVDNALATDDPKIQWIETKALAARWEAFSHGTHAKNVRKQCRNATIDALVQRATTWHDEANKTERDGAYALAGLAYEEFLAHFPEHRDAYEMRFYLAEVKWAQAERLYESPDRTTHDAGRATFCDAADVFVATLRHDPKGKFTREAAYAQMLGWKNCTDYDETGGQGVGCQAQSDGSCVWRQRQERRVASTPDTSVDAGARFPVTPYSEPEEHMLAAYERYQTYVKDADDPELPKILYHRGKLMVDHHRFDDAVPVLETLIEKFDGTRYAAWAAEMLVDVMTIRWADSANTPKQKAAASKRLVAVAQSLQRRKLWGHAESAALRAAVPTVVAATRWTIAQAHCDAGAAGDREAFVRCGAAFHAIYEDFPAHDRGDELLYNAAVAYEAGYLVGNAIQLRKALLDRHPDSKLYKTALREVAENYQAIAYYSESAERLETYAEKFSTDDYAATALGNAYLFRVGLGDDAGARADLDSYEALYRRKDPKQAAAVYWSQSDLIQTSQGRQAHAQEYIRRYGSKGGTDRLVVAHATAGQQLWRRSCDKPMLVDTCVSLQRKKAMVGDKSRAAAESLRRTAAQKIPTRCGTATRGVLVVHDRNPALVAQAAKHFGQAIALAGKGVSVPDGDAPRQEAFLDAWAMALVYRADAKYEAYLRVQMPTELDFYVEPWKKDSGVGKWEREYAAQVARRDASIARFGTFMRDKRALGDELLTAYGKVAEVKSPYWMLAAAARSAIVWQNFADQLHRAEVPKDIKTMDQYDTFCFELMDRAEPMEKMALSNFEYCLERSTTYQYFNEYSRMCQDELQQREPDRFPATNELFGSANYTDARMDVVGVQTSLQPRAQDTRAE